MLYEDSGEGKETESRGHRNVQVPAGLDRRNKHPMGLAWVALKAQAHCLRLEGSPPRAMSHDLMRLYELSADA